MIILKSNQHKYKINYTFRLKQNIMVKKLYPLLLFLAFGLINARAQSSSSAGIEAILSKMPAEDEQQFNQNMEAIGALGGNEVETMAAMLKPTGQADNTSLQYALNGFAGYIMQTGKEPWRSMSVQAFGHALSRLDDQMNQQFLIHQLQLIGKDDAVPFLQNYLQDAVLCAPAAQALATINTPAARQALIQALQKAQNNTRSALVAALGDCRSSEAAAVVSPFAKSDDAALRKASLYALANIGDPASAGILLQAAKKSGYRYEATNATSDCLLYIRRLIDAGNNTAAKKMINSLLKKTKKSDQQAVHLAALQFQEKLQHQAGEPAPNTLSKEEKKEGFKMLFDGKDLDQWTGNKEGYLVQDGNIVVNPGNGSGGNLYTEGEYGNFIFRFQFQLTPGANNGIGIRAPLQGDAAYVGMEIQVLDNTAEMYKNLHPYQYHGSVYGVIPAKRGYLKPVGEWNEEEIRAVGPKIKVTLNGHVIVDGDIDQASINGTADHKSHPGLKNKKGHIGFLGHGSVVRFRDIRIKDLGDI